MSHNITVSGGTSVRLPTAGKYCDRDIVVTATGGGGNVVNPLQYCTGLYNMFNGATFPEGYELVLDVPNLTAHTISQLTYNAKGLHKLTIKCGKPDIEITSSYAFYMSTSMRELDLSQFTDTEVVPINNAYYMFYGCSNLHTIHGVLDFAKCSKTDNAFSSAYGLEELRIAQGTIAVNFNFASCPNLSDATVQSIIDGLADLTGATTQTLTLHATVGNKLTEAQKATITAKNWTLVY